MCSAQNVCGEGVGKSGYLMSRGFDGGVGAAQTHVFAIYMELVGNSVYESQQHACWG